MKTCLVCFLGVILVFMVRAEQPSPFQGRGEWGRSALGVCCRATTDKTEYELGEPVRVLIEVRNETNRAVVLGLEPLIEVDKNGALFRQQAEIALEFSQGPRSYHYAYYITFPKGKGSEARAVVIKPTETFSEIITRTPWGPSFSSIPGMAQPGIMTLKAELLQFLSPDLKKNVVDSPTVTFSVKAAQKKLELGSAADGGQPIRSETNSTSPAADSRR